MRPLLAIGVYSFAAMLSSAACAQEQPWSFVQTVGGLKLGQAVRRPNGWMLPIDANISGLATITMQPSKVNPGMVCEETKARLEGQSIYITLVTGTAKPGTASRCPPVFIGPVTAGRYAVFYRYGGQVPVALGDVVLAR